MAPRIIWLAVAAGLTGFAASARAQSHEEPQITPTPWQHKLQVSSLRHVPSQLSRECAVRNPAFQGRSPLRSLRKALREGRPIKVLAIGSSSTVGEGASSPSSSYTVRLEHDLEGFLKGFDVEMIARGISGEVAQGAADRIRNEVAENRPDLVVWQVGTNDAMARIGEERFASCVGGTLRWLAENKIDVVLINPQYVEQLAKDEHYTKIVKVIADLAHEHRVLLVQRYEAMADLAKQNGNGTYLASDRFHLNDLGYRCMAEYAARAIVSGIVAAEAEPGQPAPGMSH